MFHKFEDFQLFLFDFDGLLVNTELLHLDAYQRACKSCHFSMNWSYDQFCNSAHYSATGMREKLTLEFPILNDDGLWNQLYHLKTSTYLSAVDSGQVELMPGVDKFLTKLFDLNKKVCVVTHSQKQMTDVIKKHIPLLQRIPNWITREDYKNPKPAPDGYQKAIEKLITPLDQVIGFEDSPRGLKSLLGAKVQAVFVTEVNYPERLDFVSQGVWHLPNFQVIENQVNNRL